jgi:hypothetical protein
MLAGKILLLAMKKPNRVADTKIQAETLALRLCFSFANFALE